MITLLSYYCYGVIAALIIGFLTGYWAWAHRKVSMAMPDISAATHKMRAGVSGAAGAAMGAAGAMADAAGNAATATMGAAAGVAGAAVGAAGSATKMVADGVSGAADAAKGAAGAMADAAGNAASATMGAAVGVAGATAGAAMATAQAVKDALPLVKPKIAAAIGEPDDLTKIKGIGPKLDALCHSLGVSRFDQIAAWTQADIDEVDQHLVGFHGRIERDEWVEQARLLAKGDIEGHAHKYGLAATKK
jgi:predicted flap endonuclease-1-like 5' DNA nuclease